MTSYAVLRELAPYADEEPSLQAIQTNPNLTKREAHELRRKHQGTAKEKQRQEQEDEWLKHNRKWFKDLVALANKASRAADVAFQCTPEKLRELAQVVEPLMLMNLRGYGNMLVKLADRLEGLLEEEEAAEQAETENAEASAPIARAHPEVSVHVGA